VRPSTRTGEEEGSSLKGKTYASYHSGWKQTFGDRPLGSFAASGVTEIETWLKTIKAVSSEVNAHRWWKYGSRFFNWAKTKKRWVKENPCELVSAKVIGNGKARKRNTRITSEMEQRLLEAGRAMPDWAFMRQWLIGALDLGLRRGELLRVQVKHVDFKTWTITLPETKAQKEQVVYAMTPRMQQVLEARRFQGPDAFVFGDENGGRVSEDRFQRRWKALRGLTPRAFPLA
jgi:integrase